MAQKPLDPYAEFGDPVEDEDPFAEFGSPVEDEPVQQVAPVIPKISQPDPLEEAKRFLGASVSEQPKIQSDLPVDVPEKSLLDKLTSPLIETPARWGKQFADYMSAPDKDDSVPMAMAKGAIGGIGEGIGNLVSSATSPVDLATAALTGGAGLAARGGLKGTSLALRNLARVPSAGMVAHGGQQVYEGAREGDLSKAGLGLAETAGGIAGGAGDLLAKRALTSLPEATPKLPITPEVPKPVKPLDYSISATDKATKILNEAGHDITGLSNKDIVEAAELVRPDYQKSMNKIRLKVDSSGKYDLNDPVTKSVVESMQTGKPVPQAQRVPDPPEMPRNALDNISDLGNTFKAINSSWDVSIPFRQGRTVMHTKAWRDAWGDMIEAGKSREAYDGVMNSIYERPNYRQDTRDSNGRPTSFAEQAGLQVGDLKNKREEDMGSSWADKWYPGVAISTRAASAFSNKTRADLFDSLISQAEVAYDQAKNMGRARRGWFTEKFDDAAEIEKLNPRTNLELAKKIASYVNSGTGRGSFGKHEGVNKAADLLNGWFFSPRFMKSRLDMMNPKNLMFTDPFVRKQYQKSAMTLASTWLTMAGLAKLGGAEVSLDPDSSEFGKIKVGDTRHDPGAGFQQYLVLAHRLGNMVDGDRYEKGGPFAPSPAKDIGNFFRNKLAPLPATGVDLLTADKKKPFEFGNAAVELGTPFSIQSLSEFAQEDPSWANAIGLGTEFFGATGSTTYETGKYGPDSRVIPEAIWPRQYDLRYPRR